MQRLSGFEEHRLSTRKKINQLLLKLPLIFAKYIESLDKQKLTDTTIYRYLVIIVSCLQDMFTKSDIFNDSLYKNISSEDLLFYFNENEHLSSGTLRLHWSALNSFCIFLVENAYLTQNPMNTIKYPENQNTKPKLNYLSIKELEKLIFSIRKNPNIFFAVRDESIIKLAISTGISIADLINLNHSDIDFNDKVLYITDKDNGKLFPLNNTLLVLLKHWSDLRKKQLSNNNSNALFITSFGNRLSDDTINEVLKKYCDQAHIKQITYKDLRSTLVYLLAKQHVPIENIMNYLGVSNYPLIIQAYDAAIKEHNSNIHDALNRLYDVRVYEHNSSPKQPSLRTIEDLDLSVRAYNSLRRAGIETVSFLVQKNGAELMKVKGLNSRALQEVYRKLKAFNISFHKDEFTFDRFRKIILGFAIGDALGVPVEFESRNALKENPVVNFREYGTHDVPKGTWSDDTSMTLATLDSLIHGINYTDMMEKFCSWMDSATYTATGKVFDMGTTTWKALRRFKNSHPALDSGLSDENSNGNGSLMRILPVAIYLYCKMPNAPLDEKIEIIHNCSALTHAHLRSKIACGIYSYVVMKLLECSARKLIPEYLQEIYAFYFSSPAYRDELNHFSRLFARDFVCLEESEIKSSGYVVHTLEAAIWAVLNSLDFEDAVFSAVNLGEDTDTVGAITGGLAACTYDIVYEDTIDVLLKKDYIESLCRRFYNTHFLCS